MKKKVELLIIGILFATAVYSLVITQLTDYVVDQSFYLGLFSIILTGLIRIKSIKISNYFLGIILLFGTFNLLSFSHVEYGFSFSLSGLKLVSVNLIMLVLLILYLLVNGPELNKLLVASSQPTEEEKKCQVEKEIERFKNKYSAKSIGELQDVINNSDSYVEAAVIAAKVLIEEKENVL